MILRKLHQYLYKKGKVKVIDSCGHGKLLTRYKLFESKLFDMNIHILHRSDEDRELHSHPWSFLTIVLRQGYIEHLPEGKTRRIRPGQILYRPASWIHRVEIIDEKPALTLCFMGKKTNDWGFITENGYVHWKDFLKKKGCA